MKRDALLCEFVNEKRTILRDIWLDEEALFTSKELLEFINFTNFLLSKITDKTTQEEFDDLIRQMENTPLLDGAIKAQQELFNGEYQEYLKKQSNEQWEHEKEERRELF